MEIVTGEPAPSVDRDEAVALLSDMAAVARTIFAVRVEADQPAAPSPAPPVTTAGSPGAPDLVAPVPVPAAIPVPAAPLAAPDPDSAERRSMALLQEIAFLDD